LSHIAPLISSVGTGHWPISASNMSSILQPWHIMLAALCVLVNQRQQQIIEFQNAQIDALLKQLGKKRLLLDDDQRRLLAVKAHAIGRKALREITTIFTPVHIAGITPSPNATWLTQVCRDLTNDQDGFLKDASHLIVDRDSSFIAMRDFLDQNTGTEVVLLPPKSPDQSVTHRHQGTHCLF